MEKRETMLNDKPVQNTDNEEVKEKIEHTLNNGNKGEDNKAEVESKNYESEIEELKKKLEMLEEEKEKYKNSFYRIMENFENYKEIVEKEKKNIKSATKKEVIEKFIIPFEKLMLCMQYKEEPEFVSAIEMVYKDMLKTFDNLKLKFITPKKGDPFDPFEHEVIEKYETNEVKEYCIFDVQSIGYELDGTVIKPAKVIVAVKPKEEKIDNKSNDKEKDQISEENSEGNTNKEGEK